VQGGATLKPVSWFHFGGPAALIILQRRPEPANRLPSKNCTAGDGSPLLALALRMFTVKPLRLLCGRPPRGTPDVEGVLRYCFTITGMSQEISTAFS